MTRYEELQKNGVEKLLTEYNHYLFGLDKKVKLKKGNIVFETTVKEVSPQGKLITTDEITRSALQKLHHYVTFECVVLCKTQITHGLKSSAENCYFDLLIFHELFA